MNEIPQMPALPPTPPSDPMSLPSYLPSKERNLERSPLLAGLDILAAERDGLVHLHNVYDSNPVAQKGFVSAVDVLVTTTQKHGRVVISGVGKSGLIGRKMIATLNSLGIRAGWMHPTEALHGDLGMIGPNDALILITFSGSTVELLSLMDHLPATCPLILMTSALPTASGTISDLPLFAARAAAACGKNVLLPTPVHVSEKALFGVSAPTVSTTVTLALGDALSMAAARKLHEHEDGVKEIFKKYHPGGAIGKDNADERKLPSPPQIVQDEPTGSSISLDGSNIGDTTDSESDGSVESDLTSSSLGIIEGDRKATDMSLDVENLISATPRAMAA